MNILDFFKNKTDRIASTHLGKRSAGSDIYDSSLLVAVPRVENRKQYNIDEKDLPFYGWDVWHAYEFSCMTKKGIPVTRLLKLKYSCTSPNIVESKSLKLYLNSFNMFKLGETIDECLDLCKGLIVDDLSLCLQSEVQVEFLDNKADRVEMFETFTNIMDLVDETSIETQVYKEAPELLEVIEQDEKTPKSIMFDSLRSNCRVTHQPDFGDVYIYYNSTKRIDESSLVKYLVSFRSEYHFHEECCEMIYKRILDLLNEDDDLFVCALYTRRGGIDICPVRCSKGLNIESLELLDLSKLARSGIKQ
jgi:7-cyano-7-deazaguanine reductase